MEMQGAAGAAWQRAGASQQQQQQQQQQLYRGDVLSPLQAYADSDEGLESLPQEDQEEVFNISSAAWSQEEQQQGLIQTTSEQLQLPDFKKGILPLSLIESVNLIPTTNSRRLLERYAVLSLLEKTVRQRLLQFQQLHARIQQQRLRCCAEQQQQQREQQQQRRPRRSVYPAGSDGLADRSSSSTAGSRLCRRRRGRHAGEWDAAEGEEAAEGGSSEDEESGGAEGAAARGSLSLLLNKQGQMLPSNADAICIWHHRSRLQPVGRSSSKAKLRAAAAAAAAASVAAASVSASPHARVECDDGREDADQVPMRALQQQHQAATATFDRGEAMLRWQLQEARVKRRRRAGRVKMLQLTHAESENDSSGSKRRAAAAADAATADLTRSSSRSRAAAEAEKNPYLLPHADSTEEAARRRATVVETCIVRSFLWQLRTALLAIPVPAGAVEALFHHCRLGVQASAAPEKGVAGEAALLMLTSGDIHPSRLLYATRNLLLACRRLRRQQMVTRECMLQQQQQETPLRVLQEEEEFQGHDTAEREVQQQQQRSSSLENWAVGGETTSRRSSSDRESEPVVSAVPTLRSLLREVCTAVAASLPPVLAALTPSECLLRFINSGTVTSTANLRLQTALAVSSSFSSSCSSSSVERGLAGAAALQPTEDGRGRGSQGAAVDGKTVGDEPGKEVQRALQRRGESSKRSRMSFGRRSSSDDATAAKSGRKRLLRSETAGSCSGDAAAAEKIGVLSTWTAADDAAAGTTDGNTSFGVCTAERHSVATGRAARNSAAEQWDGRTRQRDNSRLDDFHLLVSVERAILQGLRFFVSAQQQQDQQQQDPQQHDQQQQEEQQQQQGRRQQQEQEQQEHECLPPFCVFQVFLHLRREAEQQQQQCRRSIFPEESEQQQEEENFSREKKKHQQQDFVDKQRESQQQKKHEQRPQQQQQQLPVLVLQHRRSWTREEDERLLQAVRYVGVQQKGAGKWMRVAGLLGDRSNNQCRARYLYLMVERKRHGLFSPVEDVRLQLLVACYGRGSWGKIAKHLRGRTEMKCRERYEHCIYEDVKSLPWTRSEEALLRAAASFFKRNWQQVQAAAAAAAASRMIAAARSRGRRGPTCTHTWDVSMFLFSPGQVVEAIPHQPGSEGASFCGVDLLLEVFVFLLDLLQQVVWGRTAEQCRQRFGMLEREEEDKRCVLAFLSSCASETASSHIGGLSIPAHNTQQIAVWIQQHLLHLFRLFAPYRCFSKPVEVALQSAATSSSNRYPTSARLSLETTLLRGKREGESVLLSLAQFARYLQALQCVAVAINSFSPAAKSSSSSSTTQAVSWCNSKDSAASNSQAGQHLACRRDNLSQETSGRVVMYERLRIFVASCDYLLHSVEEALTLSSAASRLLSESLQWQLGKQVQDVEFRKRHPGFFDVVSEPLQLNAILAVQLGSKQRRGLKSGEAEEFGQKAEGPLREADAALFDLDGLPDPVLPDFQFDPAVLPEFLGTTVERLRRTSRVANSAVNTISAGREDFGKELSNTEQEKTLSDSTIFLGNAVSQEFVTGLRPSSVSVKGMRMPLRYLQQRTLPSSLVEAASKVAAREIRAWKLNTQKCKTRETQQEERPKDVTSCELLDPAVSHTSDMRETERGSVPLDMHQSCHQRQSLRRGEGADQAPQSLLQVDAPSKIQKKRRALSGNVSRERIAGNDETQATENAEKQRACTETQRGRKQPRSRISVTVSAHAEVAENAATEERALQHVSETNEEEARTGEISRSSSDTFSNVPLQHTKIAGRGRLPTVTRARDIQVDLDTHQHGTAQRTMKRRILNEKNGAVDVNFARRGVRQKEHGKSSRVREEKNGTSFRGSPAQEEKQAQGAEWNDSCAASGGAFVGVEDPCAQKNCSPAARRLKKKGVRTGTRWVAPDNAKQADGGVPSEHESASREKRFVSVSVGDTRTTATSVEEEEEKETDQSVPAREQATTAEESLRRSSSNRRNASRHEVLQQIQAGESWNHGSAPTVREREVVDVGIKEIAGGSGEDDSAGIGAGKDTPLEKVSTRHLVRRIVDFHRKLGEEDFIVEDGAPVDHAGTKLDPAWGQTVLGIPVVEKGNRVLSRGQTWRMVKRPF